MDLRSALQEWPYDEKHNARIVRGDDNREILQVRTPLGIEQFELEGRPDGNRPYECNSALDYHRQRLAEARAEGRVAEFHLSAEDCAELFDEGTLFYFRYLHLFQLKDWARTARDTARNLGLFDFVHRHATRKEDRFQLEKWRPYILRMNAVARAMIELETQNLDAALAILDQATTRIEALDELDDDTFRFERGRSLAALQEVATRIRQSRPVPELERLEKELQRAIDTQEFEQAATLRDRIRELRRHAHRNDAPDP